MFSPEERRRYERLMSRARVVISPRTQHAPVEGNALDISAGGVGVICAELLAVGEDALLTFHISAPDGVQTEEVRGRVVRTLWDDEA